MRRRLRWRIEYFSPADTEIRTLTVTGQRLWEPIRIKLGKIAMAKRNEEMVPAPTPISFPKMASLDQVQGILNLIPRHLCSGAD